MGIQYGRVRMFPHPLPGKKKSIKLGKMFKNKNLRALEINEW